MDVYRRYEEYLLYGESMGFQRYLQAAAHSGDPSSSEDHDVVMDDHEPQPPPKDDGTINGHEWWADVGHSAEADNWPTGKSRFKCWARDGRRANRRPTQCVGWMGEYRVSQFPVTGLGRAWDLPAPAAARSFVRRDVAAARVPHCSLPPAGSIRSGTPAAATV